MFSCIDHLVYGTSDLALGTSYFEEILHIKAVPGGQHLNRGTHNALIALSSSCYLEILAPDPQQKEVPLPYWIDVYPQMKPRLIRWASKCSNIEDLIKIGLSHGLDLGGVISGSRNLSDGTVLNWRLTDTRVNHFSGVMPFFIDWQNSVHPSKNIPLECSLVEMNLEHPDAEKINRYFKALSLEPKVISATAPSIKAKIQSPAGVIIIE